MARLPLLTVPDPRLRRKALPVLSVDRDVQKLMDDMLETMYVEEGCGLAAVQVNVLKRVVVVDLGSKYPEIPILKMANPEILWRSEECASLEEGCLSVPEQRGDVVRSSSIRVRYWDEMQKTHEYEVSGFFARCLQHELDHLDGKLYIDYFSPIRRERFVKNAQRVLKNQLYSE